MGSIRLLAHSVKDKQRHIAILIVVGVEQCQLLVTIRIGVRIIGIKYYMAGRLGEGLDILLYEQASQFCTKSCCRRCSPGVSSLLASRDLRLTGDVLLTFSRHCHRAAGHNHWRPHSRRESDLHADRPSPHMNDEQGTVFCHQGSGVSILEGRVSFEERASSKPPLADMSGALKSTLIFLPKAGSGKENNVFCCPTELFVVFLHIEGLYVLI